MTGVSRARTAALVFAGTCLLAAGCATTGVEVMQARTGEQVVRVRSSCTPADLAKQVWGDPQRGAEIAALARLPADQPVPRGTVIVLPGTGSAAMETDYTGRADNHFRDGLAAAKTGSYGQAAAHFREALLLDPQRVEVRFNLGLALMGDGQLSEATPVLEEVARQRPKHAESRYALGALLRKRRMFDRALGEFDATLAIDPDHRKAAYARARTLEDMGQNAKAEEAWKRFLGRFPRDPLAPEANRRLAALKSGKPLPSAPANRP
jgi:tetratricopeptide (TPR) repeat protein